MARKHEPEWRAFERLIQRVFACTPGARIRGTKWKYASADASPAQCLKNRGWADISEDRSIRLTDDGAAFAAHELPRVKDSMYGW